MPGTDGGWQHSGYDEVAAAARTQLDKAGGGALCVYVDGQPVIDIWTGYRIPATKEPWRSDTMAMSWSTTKGVASTAVHLLADRGLLDYDEPVSLHWPEFAANDKAGTTIRQVMSMEAGLYDVRHLVDDPRMILDHGMMAAALAAAPPAHEPGTANAYHAFTYGWIVGELIRRVGGCTLGELVRSEIAEPLGLDGCSIGTPAEQVGRIAAFPRLIPERPAVRAAAKVLDPLTSLFGLSLRRLASAFLPRGSNDVIPTAEFLGAEVASVNGVFTARSLARLYAALGSDDGVDGVRLWSASTRARATAMQNDRRDLVLAIRPRWRLGYLQPAPRKKTSPSSFGFYGAYGSGAFADPDRNLAVGLTCQQARGMPLFRLVPMILHAADGARPRP